MPDTAYGKIIEIASHPLTWTACLLVAVMAAAMLVATVMDARVDRQSKTPARLRLSYRLRAVLAASVIAACAALPGVAVVDARFFAPQDGWLMGMEVAVGAETLTVPEDVSEPWIIDGEPYTCTGTFPSVDEAADMARARSVIRPRRGTLRAGIAVETAWTTTIVCTNGTDERRNWLNEPLF